MFRTNLAVVVIAAAFGLAINAEATGKEMHGVSMHGRQLSEGTKTTPRGGEAESSKGTRHANCPPCEFLPGLDEDCCV